MELLNATKMQAGYTMGLDPDGRERLVVAVKGTFTIPKNGGEPALAEEQAALVMADEFTGEPGLSAPLYESDYAPHKPRCDVLLNGSAYAPGGRPTQRVTVGLQVGRMRKSFVVVGNRVWRKTIPPVAPTHPEPFRVMPISYDRAYGGVDVPEDAPDKQKAYRENPVGVGYHPVSAAAAIDGKPLPNTEESGRPVQTINGSYGPMAFGPIGRNWLPRYPLAGTYDQQWIDDVFPFLPADFDGRYYQSAPPDQQTDHLRGGEEVVLVNLTPQGRTSFELPRIEVPVTFYLKNYEQKEATAVADTLVLEPDAVRFMILWRASLPLKKNMFEVAQVVVGRMPRAWYRARELGKMWYPSLKKLVDERRREREEAGQTVDGELETAGE
jgi:hypothetical protein